MTHFERALAIRFPDSNDPVMAVWRNYALSTNERGAQVVGTLRHFRSDLRGARLLDIGCGYGGLCIAAAQQGAITTGVDIDPRLVHIATQNSLDFPALGAGLNFIQRDVIRDASQFQPFDIVCCDNVIEHADPPPRLIESISRLMTDSGFAYRLKPEIIAGETDYYLREYNGLTQFVPSKRRIDNKIPTPSFP